MQGRRWGGKSARYVEVLSDSVGFQHETRDTPGESLWVTGRREDGNVLGDRDC